MDYWDRVAANKLRNRYGKSYEAEYLGVRWTVRVISPEHPRIEGPYFNSFLEMMDYANEATAMQFIYNALIGQFEIDLPSDLGVTFVLVPAQIQGTDTFFFHERMIVDTGTRNIAAKDFPKTSE